MTKKEKCPDCNKCFEDDDRFPIFRDDEVEKYLCEDCYCEYILNHPEEYL